jgi:preprotein translocase subunit YajC
MQVADSQGLLLVVVAAMFIIFMLSIIFLTMSRIKKRRKDINERMKKLELELSGQYK